MTLTGNYGLVLPKNYVSIEKDEMEYIDGGWSITINRTTVGQALMAVYGLASAFSFFTGKTGVEIACLIGKSVLSIGKALLSIAGFGGFLIQALAFAFVGILTVSLVTIGIVCAANTSITLGF